MTNKTFKYTIFIIYIVYMNLFLQLLLFIIVLLIYIHIVHQYKKSEDLEIYELDYKDNQYLQEVCDVKQPSIFSFKNIQPEFYETINSEKIEDMETLDVKVKDIQDYWKSDESVDYVLLSHKSSQALMKTDTKGYYISEDNEQFIEDCGYYSIFNNCDSFLKPQMTVITKYDIMYGSKKSYTPFRYHNNYRYFISVNTGKIRVKMTPWKSSKYLYPISDYDNYEFKSPIDPWNTQRKFYSEMNKMKFLEFDLSEGQILYIPPYWWYTYQYQDDNTILTNFTYNTVMNCVSNIKDLSMFYIQQSNTKTKPAKTIDLSMLTKEDEDNENTTEKPVENL